MIINFDVRCLQDVNFAQRGIGQHCLYILSLLRTIAGTKIVPVVDPVLGPLLQDITCFSDASPVQINQIEGEFYFNPSPLTHDTAPFVVALRKGLTTCAVIHDFIPSRMQEFSADQARAASYQYLVNSLSNYDVLLPNSSFTESEIRIFLPNYKGLLLLLHCRPRFLDLGRTDGFDRIQSNQLRPATLKQIASGTPYVFVATADDPRKNPDIAIKATLDLKALGLTLFVGGGLGEATRKQLCARYPEQCLIGEPIFLPRLTDAELYEIYRGAKLVIVGSYDEGFSLPVAEAIALERTVVASRIPAHTEQIIDQKLLFYPDDVRSLMHAVNYALTLPTKSKKSNQGQLEEHFFERYAKIDYALERQNFETIFGGRRRRDRRSKISASLTIVGPGFNQASGIAVYNKLMVEQLTKDGIAFEYIDVDAMEPDQFYDWLLSKQRVSLIYTMGNNNTFHSNCFTALQNVPGFCILHDSRMFEFLLNRHGPHYIFNLWQQRNRSKPIKLETVIEWQRERWLLPDSFLDPIVTKSNAILVHSTISAKHIREVYGFEKVYYLPFALQMSIDEIDYITNHRSSNRTNPASPYVITSLGETEATKGCVEIIFALKILLLQGVNARLHFVGKSDDPYHTELVSAAETLAISDFVVFTNYVTRQVYLDNLASADVVVQLRYPIFGQVSGPLADAVACGTPVVTTEELAVGMDLGHRCVMIPNRFSPLHIAEGIRQIFEAHDISKNRHFNSMGNYTSRLIQIYEMMVDENYIASSSSAPGDQKLSELKNKSIEPKEAKRKRRGKKPGLENSMFDHSVD